MDLYAYQEHLYPYHPLQQDPHCLTQELGYQAFQIQRYLLLVMLCELLLEQAGYQTWILHLVHNGFLHEAVVLPVPYQEQPNVRHQNAQSSPNW